MHLGIIHDQYPIQCPQTKSACWLFPTTQFIFWWSNVCCGELPPQQRAGKQKKKRHKKFLIRLFCSLSCFDSLSLSLSWFYQYTLLPYHHDGKSSTHHRVIRDDDEKVSISTKRRRRNKSSSQSCRIGTPGFRSQYARKNLDCLQGMGKLYTTQQQQQQRQQPAASEFAAKTSHDFYY